MTLIANLISPPPTKDVKKENYDFYNSVSEVQNSLTYFVNPSVTLNPDFSLLSAKGTDQTTQLDLDGTQFLKNWSVQGVANANFAITPTAYPANSIVRSASNYYAHVQITSFTGNPFYFYQRQAMVRKYQKSYLTYGLLIKNNNSNQIGLRMDINTNYGSGGSTANLTTGSTFYVQPGIGTYTSKLLTQSLSGLTVGSSPYTEFRLNFVDLNGTGAVNVDIEIYQIKCEFGTVSTPLSDSNDLVWS